MFRDAMVRAAGREPRPGGLLIPHLRSPRFAGARDILTLAFAPLLLAGRLPLADDLAHRWCWAGAWQNPVGDPFEFGAAGSDATPAFRMLRGMAAGDSTHRRHDGVDLGNGRGGDRVVAAAHGLVIHVEPRDVGGYGAHVVVAHRTTEGSLVYSVYAHLAIGSIGVGAGEAVWTGQPLARVGHTGRASTNHLHFEVRVADDPGTRWERARAVAPLVFVRHRLARAPRDTTWCAPYLAWAEACGLVERAVSDPQMLLTRSAWHRMLAHTARHDLTRVPRDARALERALAERGLLPRTAGAGAQPVLWAEIARDLERLEAAGHRLPPLPVALDAHRDRLGVRFGAAGVTRSDLGRRPGAVRLGEALLVLADHTGAGPDVAIGPPAPH